MKNLTIEPVEPPAEKKPETEEKKEE
jgi:hypothetical protein